MPGSHHIVVALVLLTQLEWAPLPLGPAYLTESPVQLDRLGLATMTGRYSVVLGDGCTGVVPYQNIRVLAANEHGAALQAVGHDGDQLCSVLVEQAHGSHAVLHECEWVMRRGDGTRMKLPLVIGGAVAVLVFGPC